MEKVSNLEPLKIAPKPLGLVWIHTSYPVLALGLKESLKTEAQVYRGITPPTNATPSSVVYCPDEHEDIAKTVARYKNAVPNAPVLVFGLNPDLRLARAALQARASGFLHARMQPKQIVRALEVASGGEIAIPRELLRDLVTNETHIDLNALSARQREILDLVVEGLTNAEIAGKLYLSESTVKQHLRAAYKVLGVENRTKAAKIMRGAWE